jgi:hypothetical protein
MGVGQVLTMPLFFASNAIDPIEIMPGWLQAVAHANPLTCEVDAPCTFMPAAVRYTSCADWSLASRRVESVAVSSCCRSVAACGPVTFSPVEIVKVAVVVVRRSRQAAPPALVLRSAARLAPRSRCAMRCFSRCGQFNGQRRFVLLC